MKKTEIQWCDSTINPAPGCDGCELWATSARIVAVITQLLAGASNIPAALLRRTVKSVADRMEHQLRGEMITNIICTMGSSENLNLKSSVVKALIRTAKAMLLKCYAGRLTERWKGNNRGYPQRFDQPTPFPGRSAEAASWSDLTGTERTEKPWLNGLPRLIFVSDMGDALSASISFEFLKQEIIDVAASPKGQRHIWQWLTKRPLRMAQFSDWLVRQGVAWPDNLMAMTSVTSDKTVRRVDQLRRVQCAMRGISVEPLWSAVTLPLEGIDWVIVGGESGSAEAEPFDLAWARDLREQCRRAGVAFFVKQFGRNPVEGGQHLNLKDSHGGDWAEWPSDLRIRQMPEVFRRGGLITLPAGGQAESHQSLAA